MPPTSHLLLTGGAGYIGSVCAHLLIKQGFKITILDNLSGGAEPPQFGHFIFGDVRNSALLDDLFSSCKIDAVLHFAGQIQVGESVTNPLPYYDSNVTGTLRLLEAMMRHHIRHLVFSSTAAVYGNPIRLPIDEQHPIAPLSPYGATKATAERIIQDCSDAYGINAIILRYFNAAGALPDVGLGESHLPETHFIPLLIHSALQKATPFQVYGNTYDTPDGSCIRDYIHVRDLATAHIQALEMLNDGQSGTHHYNLGSGAGYSVFEVISELEHIIGTDISYQIASPRRGDPPVLITDSRKANTELSWSAQKDLQTILKDALLFIQSSAPK